MSYRYRISQEHHLVLVEAAGTVTGAEIIASVGAMFADPNWRYGMRQINDFRQIIGLVMGLEDLDAISRLEHAAEDAARARAAASGETLPQPKLAIVATDAMYEPMCKLYAVRDRTRELRVHVTRSMDEAASWVGLDIDLDQAMRAA